MKRCRLTDKSRSLTSIARHGRWRKNRVHVRYEIFEAKNRNKIKLSIKKTSSVKNRSVRICILYKFYIGSDVCRWVRVRFGRTRETGYLHFIYFFGRFHEWTFPSVVSATLPPLRPTRGSCVFLFYHCRRLDIYRYPDGGAARWQSAIAQYCIRLCNNVHSPSAWIHFVWQIRRYYSSTRKIFQDKCDWRTSKKKKKNRTRIRRQNS